MNSPGIRETKNDLKHEPAVSHLRHVCQPYDLPVIGEASASGKDRLPAAAGPSASQPRAEPVDYNPSGSYCQPVLLPPTPVKVDSYRAKSRV